MVITEEMKFRLAHLIEQAIKNDFKYVHLSGNLMDSIDIYQDIYTYIDEDSGKPVRSEKIIVDITAPRYSIATFLRTGAIIPTGRGSYASTVDKKGGFTGKHKEYAERAISTAISIWLKEYNLEGMIS